LTVTRILLTGFEPFDGLESNPSWEAALRAAELWDDSNHDVVAERLPVDFDEAPRYLATSCAKHRPEVVINIGVAIGRSHLCVERVAINCIDARIPDNRGRQPVDEPVVAGGPNAYFSTLPIHRIVAAWESEGLSGRISNSAGTYVCNRILYETLHTAEGRGILRGGFIHVPLTPETATTESQPVMDQQLINRGVDVALREVVRSLAGTTD